jgi:quercetin dioxygenase-like cupin family protein
MGSNIRKLKTIHLGRHKTEVRSIVALICLNVCLSALAQVSPIERKVVVKGDVSISEREAIIVKVDIPLSGAIGRHTHHGEEIGYVERGGVEMLIEGESPRLLKSGDGFIIPSGKVHEARNVGDETARVIVTYVVEKGKPLSVPAK